MILAKIRLHKYTLGIPTLYLLSNVFDIFKGEFFTTRENHTKEYGKTTSIRRTKYCIIFGTHVKYHMTSYRI